MISINKGIKGGLGDYVVNITYLKRDTFLNALECVELGIVDSIL